MLGNHLHHIFAIYTYTKESMGDYVSKINWTGVSGENAWLCMLILRKTMNTDTMWIYLCLPFTTRRAHNKKRRHSERKINLFLSEKGIN